MKQEQIIYVESLDSNGEITIPSITAKVGKCKAELENLVDFKLQDDDKDVTAFYKIRPRVTGGQCMNGSGKDTTVTFSNVVVKATKKTVLNNWEESVRKGDGSSQ